jgi:hypothetical protein
MGALASHQGDVAEEFFYNSLREKMQLGGIAFDTLFGNFVVGNKNRRLPQPAYRAKSLQTLCRLARSHMLRGHDWSGNCFDESVLIRVQHENERSSAVIRVAKRWA